MKTKKVSELTKEELWEQCALVQGWEIYEAYHLKTDNTYADEYGNYITNGKSIMFVADYQPTANTVEGRSQCFELMVKFGLNVCFGTGWMVYTPPDVIKGQGMNEKFKVDDDSLWQRAICEAAVMSVKGEEVEL